MRNIIVATILLLVATACSFTTTKDGGYAPNPSSQAALSREDESLAFDFLVENGTSRKIIQATTARECMIKVPPATQIFPRTGLNNKVETNRYVVFSQCWLFQKSHFTTVLVSDKFRATFGWTVYDLSNKYDKKRQEISFKLETLSGAGCKYVLHAPLDQWGGKRLRLYDC